jgi:hypothetical protein
VCPTEAKREGKSSEGSLLPDSQALDQTQISRVIVLLEIIEQPPSLPDKHKEASAGVVIFDMNLEVSGEVLDTLAEQSHLHFRRTGVRVVELELLYNLPLLLLSNTHVFSANFLSFLQPIFYHTTLTL